MSVYQKKIRNISGRRWSVLGRRCRRKRVLVCDGPLTEALDGVIAEYEEVRRNHEFAFIGKRSVVQGKIQGKILRKVKNSNQK